MTSIKTLTPEYNVLELQSTEQFDELFKRMCEESPSASVHATEMAGEPVQETVGVKSQDDHITAVKLDQGNYPLNGRRRHQLPWKGDPVDPRRRPEDTPRRPMYLQTLRYERDNGRHQRRRSSWQARRSQQRLEEFMRKRNRVV